MNPEDAQRAVSNLIADTTEENLVPMMRKLHMLADYKYDEYQQFAPGHYFVESLISWLLALPHTDRAAALDFALERMLFLGRGDIYHFTKIAYRHTVRPELLRWEANRREIPLPKRAAFGNSPEFHSTERHCIYLGMSDGAHIDDFRRLGKIDNDQVHSTYQLSPARLGEMSKKWKKYRDALADKTKPGPMLHRFFLVDDFSGSGTTILRQEKGEWTGRYVRFLKELADHGKGFVDFDGLEVHLLIYVISAKAKQHLTNALDEYRSWRQANGMFTAESSILDVQYLNEQFPIQRSPTSADQKYHALVQNYDLGNSWDDALARGGEKGHHRWGYAECALPLVLYHNTPNNSIAPLWMYDDEQMPGLFPRVRRHREPT